MKKPPSYSWSVKLANSRDVCIRHAHNWFVILIIHVKSSPLTTDRRVKRRVLSILNRRTQQKNILQIV